MFGARTIAQIRERQRMMSEKPRRRKMPKQRHPTTIALAYFQDLRALLKPMLTLVAEHILPLLPEWQRSAGTYKRDAEGPNTLIEQLGDQFIKELDPRKLDVLVGRIANTTSEFQKEQLNAQVRSQLGADVFSYEPWLNKRLASFTSENVALIKSIPREFFSDIEKLTTRAVSSGMRVEELAKQIGERYQVSESKAKLIARDQIGKLTGRLNAERQQELGVTQFVWQTSEDERVREEHEELDGQTFSYADPPSEGLPGEPILCRCTAEPVIDIDAF